MKKICPLKNTIQKYAWGSYAAIPKLLGRKVPSVRPEAELWMGAHPKAPSMAKCDGKWISLLELIKKNPEDILGKEVAEQFDGRLPYLFKVLAAAKPLSIQAHPNLAQAKEGFERENSLGISLDASNRNYKDSNHKPECICALTGFWALNGFRRISESLSLMEKICSQGLRKELDDLQKQQNSKGLKSFFNALMTMNHERQKQVTANAIINAQKHLKNNSAFKWMINLYNEYPEDIGIFSPILLNLIFLKPGQAMFLPAGELHAYLSGMGIELMANSDNVLRGGLTPKHVDLPELLKVLNFEEREVKILAPQKKRDCESIYSSSAEEFILSVISGKEGITYTSPEKRSIEIILCAGGEAAITNAGKENVISLVGGTSVVIPASVERYKIEGKATLYKASVPI